MSCFQVVKQVLDVLYTDIPGNKGEKDKLIRQALDQLQGAYKGVHEGPKANYYLDFDPFAEESPYHFDIETPIVNYSTAEIRFAYVYKYMASHADMVYQCICENDSLRRLFNKNELSLCCIGCGPGSDLLGVLKFWQTVENPPELPINFYDRETSWSEELNLILQKAVNHQEAVHIQHLNIGNSDLSQYEEIFSTVDLFTMVYFVSEVYANRYNASWFFDHLIASMKSGAMILFIDNGSPPDFYEWFDNLARNSGLEPRGGNNTHPFRIGQEEQKTDLGKYYTKYSPFHEPKLTATIAYRIYRKR